MNEEQRFAPVIADDWRLLYKPEKTGCYLNDHCVIQAQDGSWHLFGITRNGSGIDPDQEYWFTHGRGEHLIQEGGLNEVGRVCDTGLRAWAPCEVLHDGRYYMHYGPAPLRLAISDELCHWMENPVYLHDAPLDSCHRDSMVLQLEDGSWLMYATGIHNRYGVISLFRSDDLVNWHFLKYRIQMASGISPLMTGVDGTPPLKAAWRLQGGNGFEIDNQSRGKRYVLQHIPDKCPTIHPTVCRGRTDQLKGIFFTKRSRFFLIYQNKGLFRHFGRRRNS